MLQEILLMGNYLLAISCKAKLWTDNVTDVGENELYCFCSHAQKLTLLKDGKAFIAIM